MRDLSFPERSGQLFKNKSPSFSKKQYLILDDMALKKRHLMFTIVITSLINCASKKSHLKKQLMSGWSRRGGAITWYQKQKPRQRRGFI